MFEKIRTGAIVVSALALTCVCALSGCGEKEQAQAPAVDPSSPESYMNDKEFIGKLERLRSERTRLQLDRAKAMEEYQAALKDDPNAEKPETKQLKERILEIEKAFMENRQKTMTETRNRIKPNSAQPKQK